MKPTSRGKAAILIVNGGADTEANRWIHLCLERIAALTQYPNYHIYLWNNRIGDSALDAWLLARPHLTLISAAPYERMHHPHRTPLQRLYHLAREEGARYIIALDSDAHPLRPRWLAELLGALDGGAALAGVWRAEMAPAIRSHVHASCLCTTVDFIEQHQLRFDFDNTHSDEPTDTLAHFTWIAEANGLPIHRLVRSNRRSFHSWMGGIYGDLIYHHVAASRQWVAFYNSPSKGVVHSDENRYLRNEATDLLFNEYDAYIGWLQGNDVGPRFDARMQQVCNNATRSRNTDWWLQRMRSAYLRKEARQRIEILIKTRLKRVAPITRITSRLRRAVRTMATRVQKGEQQTYRPLLGSFQRENLAPLASYGWRLHPPDFVGIGAAKSGTTWWYQLLMAHPQIVDNRVRRPSFVNKETQYLLHFQYGTLPDEAISLYHEAFATPLGAICGEFSSQYLAYPTCLEQLALVAPNTKIVVILRNPIDRFFSHLNQLIVGRGRRFFGNLSQSQRYIFNTYASYTEATLHSLYSIGLTRLFHYFNRDQVLVLQYEHSVRSPQEELAHTYRFLGVDDRFRPKNEQQRFNQGHYAIARPDAEERARLAAYYRDDVERVFALCPELDPTLWPDFSVECQS